MTSQAQELFTRHWDTYRQMVEHDWMEHAALAEATAAVIDRWLAARPADASPPRFTDLGCGDLAQVAPLLRRLPLGGYLGIDLAEGVFPLARSALGPVSYPCQWRRQDLLAWATDEPGDAPVEIVHASFSIHHLQDPEKQRFLAGCRRRLAPGGLLLWADVFREPGETRQAYVERYAERVRGTWLELEPSRREEVVEHLSGFDHPTDRLAVVDLAAGEGWSLEWAWHGHHRAEALALLRPATRPESAGKGTAHRAAELAADP